jgi:hypothetical protein
MNTDNNELHNEQAEEQENMTLCEAVSEANTSKQQQRGRPSSSRRSANCQFRGTKGPCKNRCLEDRQYCYAHVKKTSMPKCLMEGCEKGTRSATGYCPCSKYQHETSRRQREVERIKREAIAEYLTLMSAAPTACSSTQTDPQLNTSKQCVKLEAFGETSKQTD